MYRHPHYLDIPWNIHWEAGPRKGSHMHGWLIVAVVLLVRFLIGVGVVSGR